MSAQPSLCLIVPTYNRSHSLLRLLSYLNKNIDFLNDVSVYINSSSDDGSDEYVKERLKEFNKGLNITFVKTPKTTLSVAIRESLLLAPGSYKSVIADDSIIYPSNIPLIISELREHKPLFYRSYFVGYHSHSQSCCRTYRKPESILFAAQHLGFIYASEAINLLRENNALCFCSIDEQERELAYIQRVQGVTSIIIELLFLTYNKYPTRFVTSGIPFVGFSHDNQPSEQAKSSTFPYWHVAFLSEDTWSVIVLINRLSEKYCSIYSENLRSRLANVYIFDSILRTLNFYIALGLIRDSNVFIRIKRFLKIIKVL